MDIKGREISVIVVGGSYAGAAAAKKLAGLRGYPSLKVTLIDQKSHYYHSIGFPKALVDDKYAEQSFLPFSKFFPPDSPHRFIQGKLQQIKDPHNLVLADGQEIYFDYLVLATGGRAPGPINPFADTMEAGLEEIRELRGALEKAKKILVIGGGPVGVEVAGFVAATYPDKQVTLVHGGKRLLQPNMVGGLGRAACEKLKQVGAHVVLNEHLDIPDDFGYQANTEYRVLKGSSGQEYESDVQILATGFRVDSEYLAPLETDQVKLRIEGTGAIRVRRTLQLDSDELAHILVPGDCNTLPMSAKYGFKAEMQSGTAANNIAKMIEAGYDYSRCPMKLDKWSDLLDATMVPVGPHLGVMQALKCTWGGGWMGDFMVRQMKTRDFMLWMRKSYFK